MGASTAKAERESLVTRAIRMDRRDPAFENQPLGRPNLTAEGWEPEVGEGTAPLADGYVRRSPVQSYRTPVGYRKSMIRKILLIAGLVLLAAGVIAILIANNFFGLISR